MSGTLIPSTVPSFPQVVYCADEDVATRAPDDFAVLCPKGQSFAAGADGTFSPGAQWVLNSPSIDFGAAGIVSRCVVKLTAPRPPFTSSGQLFAVDSVSGHSVTLRGIGFPSGLGLPPAPAAGLTAVAFDVPTLLPQIVRAVDEANHYLGIDANLADRAPARLYDPNSQLLTYAVLLVLERRYTSAVRSDGDFKDKLKNITTDLDAFRARMVVKWGSLGEGAFPTGQTTMRRRR
jgi:hypothetical protein